MWPFKKKYKEVVYSEADETIEQTVVKESPIDFRNHLGTFYTNNSVDELKLRVSRVNKILSNVNKLNTALINEEKWLHSVINFKKSIDNLNENN